ncbi:Chain U Ribosomal Protein S10p/S20e [Trichomonas vaginalis G3]|nr:Chain U Ribosomal Protein S10p/S20e [Trichomonas vaginalis G3]KAI5501586.1 Chain U Ribosomal Protein S10p/S20e [Trichomonas vaginalis G3]
MRVLFLVAHVDPTHKATAFRFADSAKAALEKAGHEVRYVNLVESGFDRTLTTKDFKKIPDGTFSIFAVTGQDNLVDEIKVQQENLKWATHVVIFAPMWYGRFPSCVYAYTERVLNVPFAWDFEHMLDKGYLAGKKVTSVISTGGAPMFFDPKEGNGLDAYTWSALYAFNYSGFTILRSIGIHGANSPKRIAMQPELQQKLNEKLLNLDNWKVITDKKFIPLATLDQITEPENLIQ